jgi:hypothetical protein
MPGSHQPSEIHLLTAFRTIYYQLVQNVHETVAELAETNRLVRLGNSIDEFNEQVQQVSKYTTCSISIGIETITLYPVSFLTFSKAMNMEFCAQASQLCRKKSE